MHVALDEQTVGRLHLQYQMRAHLNLTQKSGSLSTGSRVSAVLVECDVPWKSIINGSRTR